MLVTPATVLSDLLNIIIIVCWDSGILPLNKGSTVISLFA